MPRFGSPVPVTAPPRPQRHSGLGPVVTPEHFRNKREEIENEYDRALKELEDCQARIKALRYWCPHTEGKTSGSFIHCADCGLVCHHNGYKP